MNEIKLNYRYIDKQRAKQENYAPLYLKLFNNEYFAGLSNEAKILYSLMRNRIQLSFSKGEKWVDEETGYAFILYSVEEAAKQLGTSRPTTIKIFKELEDWNMIDRRKNGSKAPRIFVKDIFSREGEDEDIPYNSDYEQYEEEELPYEEEISLQEAYETDEIITEEDVEVKKFNQFENQTSRGKKTLPQEVYNSNFSDVRGKKTLPPPLKNLTSRGKEILPKLKYLDNIRDNIQDNLPSFFHSSADIIDSRDVILNGEGKKESDILVSEEVRGDDPYFEKTKYYWEREGYDGDVIELEKRYDFIKDPKLDRDTFIESIIKLTDGYIIKELWFAENLVHDLLNLSSYDEGGHYERLSTNKRILDVIRNIFIEILMTDEDYVEVGKTKARRILVIDRLLQIQGEILPNLLADLQTRQGQTIKSPTKYMRKLLFNAANEHSRLLMADVIGGENISLGNGWSVGTKWDGYNKH